jgi:hypothetical protein
MNPEIFWRLIALIDQVRLAAGDQGDALAPLQAALEDLEVAELFAFDELLARALYDLDTPRHLDEAGASSGSADAFLHARCWVVARGLEHYVAVRKDPALMPQSQDEWCEPLLLAAQEAWAAKTGAEPADYPHISTVSYETGANRDAWDGRRPDF